jgi:hypothetical protein
MREGSLLVTAASLPIPAASLPIPDPTSATSLLLSPYPPDPRRTSSPTHPHRPHPSSDLPPW